MSNGWLAQPGVFLFDRESGRFTPKEQGDCKHNIPTLGIHPPSGKTLPIWPLDYSMCTGVRSPLRSWSRSVQPPMSIHVVGHSFLPRLSALSSISSCAGSSPGDTVSDTGINGGRKESTRHRVRPAANISTGSDETGFSSASAARGKQAGPSSDG
jgi:hypothetical protein